MSEGAQRRARVVAAFGLTGTVGAAVIAVASQDEHVPLVLLALLVASGLAAELADTQVAEHLWFSGAFLAGMLAAAFVGPLGALLVPLVGQLGAWLVQRRRLPALALNLAGSTLPTVLAALALEQVAHRTSPGFFVALYAISWGVFAASFAIVAPLMAWLDRRSVVASLAAFKDFLAPLAVNIALALAGAAIYLELGTAAIAFALAGVISFSFSARLAAAARRRASQHAALSWGVLAGLIRASDARDPRASRHAAAVAAYARDIAQAGGMSRADCELAHTAGLLHDIGRFALSDRVHERGRVLTEDDWEAIRRHPELGADLLRDLGAYGPVAELVRAHHERIDGRGYPDGLAGDEIPEIARIVAVAEVYDTLTADDTYRTPVSSFDALRELRRVAGTQLDERYVETLATLLAGRGHDERHAASASFEGELAIERRIAEAATGPAPTPTG